MKTKQLDFQRLFFDHFGNLPKKVTYRVRRNSNRYHDLVFLNCLIHDARFKMKNVGLRGKCLTIPINRDCWELGFTKNNGVSELHIADSRLTISPVASVEWHFPHGCEVQKTELWIADLWLNREGKSKTRDLVINGHHWSCVITLRAEDIRICLADTETPYLFSEKKKRRPQLPINRLSR